MKKVWKIFKKIIEILSAFIPIHEAIVNKKEEDKK